MMSAGSAFALGLIVPAHTAYYLQTAGMSPLQLVLVGTALEASYFLCEVPTGILADTFSRRLSVIIGLALIGLSWIVQGVIPLFGAIILTEVFRGIGEAFRSGAAEAWLADEADAGRAGAIFLEAAQVGQVSHLAGLMTSVGLMGVGLNVPVLAAGLVFLVAAAALAVLMPERGFRRLPREARSWQALGDTLQEGVRLVRGSPLLLAILGISLFFGLSSEGFDRLRDAHFLVDFALPRLGRLAPVAWLAIIQAAALVLGIVATGVVRRRIDPAKGVALSRALQAFSAIQVGGVVAFALAGNFPMAVGTYSTVAIARRLIAPLYTAWLTQQTTAQVRATVISMSGQADALGEIIGGPAVGAVGNVSIRAAIAVSGVILSPVLILLLRASALARGRQGFPPAVGPGATQSGM